VTTTETPSAPRQSAGRTGLTIGGGILATVGSVIALGGVGILAVAGSDGKLATRHHDVSTPTTALVSEVATINGTADVTKVLGHARVSISADSVRPGPGTFVGIGPRAQVDRYLAGAPIDRVTDFETDPFTLDKTRVPGTAKVKPPATQSFWVAKDSGRTASIDWKVRDGNYRVVVMNADGKAGVATQSKFEVQIPHLETLAIALLIVGLIGVGGGTAMIALSLSSGGRREPQAPVTQASYAIG
jgi:hypothetical protein